MGNIQPYYNGTGYGLNFIELLMIYNQMPASQQQEIFNNLDNNSPLRKILKIRKTEENTSQTDMQGKTQDNMQEFRVNLRKAYDKDVTFHALTEMGSLEFAKFTFGTPNPKAPP